MPRRPRLFVPGLSQHVIQRGNNRVAIFRVQSDYRLFLDVLLNSARKNRVDVHGYVLMTNHVHLIVTPAARASLPKLMQSVGRVYVQAFNQQHGRTGTLWDSRYRALLIDDERYWLTCLRYIELNPVRAGLVARPELYEWSSYQAHAFGRADALLSPHPLFLTTGRTAGERQEGWRAICKVDVGDEELTSIRHAIRTSRSIQSRTGRSPQQTSARGEAGLATPGPTSDSSVQGLIV